MDNDHVRPSCNHDITDHVMSWEDGLCGPCLAQQLAEVKQGLARAASEGVARASANLPTSICTCGHPKSQHCGEGAPASACLMCSCGMFLGVSVKATPAEVNASLLDALRALYEACLRADSIEELPMEVDGSLLDAARVAIAKAESR